MSIPKYSRSFLECSANPVKYLGGVPWCTKSILHSFVDLQNISRMGIEYSKMSYMYSRIFMECTKLSKIIYAIFHSFIIKTSSNFFLHILCFFQSFQQIMFSLEFIKNNKLRFKIYSAPSINFSSFPSFFNILINLENSSIFIMNISPYF